MTDDTAQPDASPTFGEALAPAFENSAFLAALRRRRSTQADLLGDPGPTPDQLNELLTIAARVPDHRRVNPFRFVIFTGDARARAGDSLAAAFRLREPDAEETAISRERGRFMRAPVIVLVVSTIDYDHKTPEWEQTLTAGAVCMNLLTAAKAQGFAAQWLTEWYAYDRDVCSDFGLAPHERVAGFIYIGTAQGEIKERQRPQMAEIVRHY